MTAFTIIAETFLYLPETVWEKIIAAVVTLLLGYMAIKAKEASSKVDEVKTTLEVATKKADDKTDAMADVLNDVHTLTNSSMGLALESNANLARWKADQTHDPTDETAARKAEKALLEHKSKQKTVDDGKDSK